MIQIASLVLLLAFSLAAGGNLQQQPQPHYTVTLPNQEVDLAPSIMSTASQSCENWALAAGLETILQRQDVALDQRFWVVRLSGGEVCTPAMPSIDRLTQVVNKEFALDDGRRVRLELRFVSGAPIDAAALVVGLKKQQLSLFLWHGHPYYMSGVTYDEMINDGVHSYAIKELRLANTYPKRPKTTFQRGRDNVNEIEGVFTVNVIPQ
jgi:hypothetical protein